MGLYWGFLGTTPHLLQSLHGGSPISPFTSVIANAGLSRLIIIIIIVFLSQVRNRGGLRLGELCTRAFPWIIHQVVRSGASRTHTYLTHTFSRLQVPVVVRFHPSLPPSSFHGHKSLPSPTFASNTAYQPRLPRMWKKPQLLKKWNGLLSIYPGW